MHVNDPLPLRALQLAQQHEYRRHGHGHQWRGRHVGGIRIISSGTAALLRNKRPLAVPTCAMLDVEVDRPEKIVLA